jgi:hypothetical protein
MGISFPQRSDANGGRDAAAVVASTLRSRLRLPVLVDEGARHALAS